MIFLDVFGHLHFVDFGLKVVKNVDLFSVMIPSDVSLDDLDSCLIRFGTLSKAVRDAELARVGDVGAL